MSWKASLLSPSPSTRAAGSALRDADTIERGGRVSHRPPSHGSSPSAVFHGRHTTTTTTSSSASLRAQAARSGSSPAFDRDTGWASAGSHRLLSEPIRVTAATPPTTATHTHCSSSTAAAAGSFTPILRYRNGATSSSNTPERDGSSDNRQLTATAPPATATHEGDWHRGSHPSALASHVAPVLKPPTGPTPWRDASGQHSGWRGGTAERGRGGVVSASLSSYPSSSARDSGTAEVPPSQRGPTRVVHPPRAAAASGEAEAPPSLPGVRGGDEGYWEGREVRQALFRDGNAEHLRSPHARTIVSGSGGSKPLAPSHTDWVGLQVHLRARTHGTQVTVLHLTAIRLEERQWRWCCREALPELHALDELLLVDMGLTDADVHELLIHGCQVGRTESAIAGAVDTEKDEDSNSASPSLYRAASASRLGGSSHRSLSGDLSTASRRETPRPLAGRAGGTAAAFPRRRAILPCLRVVDLSRNCFTHKSANSIGKMLLWAADTLTDVRLARNALGDYGLRVLAIYLSKLNHRTLRTDPRLFPECLSAQYAAALRSSNGRGSRSGNNSACDAATTTEGGSGPESARRVADQPLSLTALRISPSTVDLRNCRASARGVSEVLAGASRTPGISRVLLSHNLPGAFAEADGVDHAGSPASAAESVRPSVVTSGELLTQPPFSQFLPLDCPNSLSEVDLAEVPLSQMCSPLGCRELFLHLFFCSPQLDKLSLSNCFERSLVSPAASAKLMDLGRRQQALGRALHSRDAQAAWQRFLEEEGEASFTLDDGASLCKQTRVGDVLGELIAHAAYNASTRQRPVPPAFAHLRELCLKGTGLTDMAVRGMCIALRCAAKVNAGVKGNREGNEERSEVEESASPRDGDGGGDGDEVGSGSGMLQSLAVLNVSNNYLTASGCEGILQSFLVNWPLQSRGLPSALVSLAMEGNAGVDSEGGQDVAEVGMACQAALAHRQGEIAAFAERGTGKRLPLTISFGPCNGSGPVYHATCDAEGRITSTYQQPLRPPLRAAKGYSRTEETDAPPSPPHGAAASGNSDSNSSGSGVPPRDPSPLSAPSEDTEAPASVERPAALYPPQRSVLEEPPASEREASGRLVSPPLDDSVAEEGGAAAGRARSGGHIRQLAAEMPLHNTVNKYKRNDDEGSPLMPGAVKGDSPPPRVEGVVTPPAMALAPPPPPSPPPTSQTIDAKGGGQPRGPDTSIAVPEGGHRSRDWKEEDEEGALQQIDATAGSHHHHSCPQGALLGSSSSSSTAVARMRTFALTYIHPPGHLFCRAMRVLQSPDAHSGLAARRALEADLLTLLTAPKAGALPMEAAQPAVDGEEQDGPKAAAAVGSTVERVSLAYNELVTGGTMRLEVTCNERRAAIAQRLQRHLSVEAPEEQRRLFHRLTAVLAEIPGWDTIEEVALFAKHSHHVQAVLSEVYDGSPTVAVHRHHSAEDTSRLIAVLREADSRDTSEKLLSDWGPPTKDLSTFEDETVSHAPSNSARSTHRARQENNRGGHHPHFHYANAGGAQPLPQGGKAGEARPSTFRLGRLDLYSDGAGEDGASHLKRLHSLCCETSTTDPDVVEARADALGALKLSPDDSPLFSSNVRAVDPSSSDLGSLKGQDLERRAARSTLGSQPSPPREPSEPDTRGISPPRRHDALPTSSNGRREHHHHGTANGGAFTDDTTPLPGEHKEDSSISPPIRVQRDHAGLTGRIRTFVTSYAHSEGGVLCRGWRLLSNSAATAANGGGGGPPSPSAEEADDRREARRRLEEDFLALLQPPDSDSAHVVESVRIPVEHIGVSSMLPLHVATNERRATIAARLQATLPASTGSSPSASSPTLTANPPKGLDNGDREFFPRFSSFLLSRQSSWDTLAMVEGYLGDPGRTELKRRLTVSYRSLPTLVHYHHGTTSALLRELGVDSMAALMPERRRTPAPGDGSKAFPSPSPPPTPPQASSNGEPPPPETLDSSASSSVLFHSEPFADPGDDDDRAEERDGSRDSARSQPQRGRGPPPQQRGPVPPTSSPTPSSLSASPHDRPFPAKGSGAAATKGEEGGDSQSAFVVSSLSASANPSAVSAKRQRQPSHQPPPQQGKEQASSSGKGGGGDDDRESGLMRGQEEPRQSRRGGTPPPPSQQQQQRQSEWDRLRENKHKRLFRMGYDSMVAGAIPLDAEGRGRVRVAKGKWDGQRVLVTLEWQIFLVLYFERPRSFGSTRRALMLVHPVAIGFSACRSSHKGEEKCLILQFQRSFEADSLGVSMAVLAGKLDEGVELTRSSKDTRKEKEGGAENAALGGEGADSMGKSPFTKRLLNPLIVVDVALKSSGEVDRAVSLLDESVRSAAQAIEKSMEASGVPGGPNHRGRSAGRPAPASRMPTVPQ